MESSGAGINWYNDSFLASSPGGQDNFAWSGSKPTGEWRNARFNLDQIPLAERNLVRFRIAFASNGDNPSPEQNPSGQILNGFAFDNIYIGEKNRNVLVEHFTNDNSASSNASDVFLDGMYDAQIAAKDSSDFIAIQYHIGNDPLYHENTGDPSARAILYGVSQTPTTIMDGIQGPYYATNFDGLLAKVSPVEIDRRALEDPLFRIQVDTVASGENASLRLRLRYTYIDSIQNLDIPVTLHAALIERGVNGNRNVVRKLLLRSDGLAVDQSWTEGTFVEYDVDYSLDVPIVNPDNLYVVAFVQDNSGEGSPTARRILQTVIVKAPRKVGPLITGIEDDQAVADLKNLVVYPNPASKVFNLHSGHNFNKDYDWKLIDQRGVTVMAGQVQRNFDFGDQQIPIGNLPNGVYILAIQIGERSVVHKKVVVLNGN